MTPPSGDTVAWSPTTITYTKVATTEYGVGAQHWRRSETRGTYQRHTYYDALWRPVIERELDTANTATQRFRGWKYDSDGRVTFEGYPRTSASSISSFTTGVTSTFDALDRPVTVRQASELGDLTTSYAYLSSFRTQVTPPRGSLARSTISYQAFDTPTTDFPSKIEAPETQLTVITRDPFSRPINITRSGTYAGTAVSATRTYTYHSTGGELCKRTDPETGASFFGYDGASNLLWSAEGTHLTGYNCSSSPPLAERTTRTYDTLNRLKSVTYPSGTNGITYGYKPDGALAWVNTTDGIDWTYEYNKLRLLTSEQTSLEGMTFTHAYTSLGHLSSTRYPHGVTVSYAPNALGQPTRVGSFATAATYHPNGALKSFVYGNLYTRTYSQNARMLVSRIEDKYGTSYLHDFQHVYDQAGNLTSITDAPGIADRTMAYDYLDRLVTANASSLWGLGRYAYDPLDNLREADIGARKYNYNYATNWRLSNIRTDAGTTVWNFGYDVRGNQTGKGSQSYTFDRANRITAIPGLVSTYFYDGHGRRQAEIRATGHARYTLRTKDGLMRGGPDSAKSAGVWHYYLGSQLVATTTNPHSGATPTTAYQHTDHLGSVIRETGPTRNTISQTYYEPYGQPTNRTVDGPGYTGHVMDAPSGLIYMEQRYYDPLVGRFLGIDPMDVQPSTAINFSRYWYANDNPYRFTDPDGRESVGELIDLAAEGCSPVSCAGWAVAKASWDALGAEGVSQMYDKGFGAGAGTGAIAVLEVATLGKGSALLKAGGAVADAASTLTIKGLTGHAVDQAIERGVKPVQILDAIRNPLKVADARVDEFGRQSQKVVGAEATVIVNPETGKIVTVYPTSTKTANKLRDDLK